MQANLPDISKVLIIWNNVRYHEYLRKLVMRNVISIPVFANGLNKYQIWTNIEIQDTYFVGCSLYIQQAYKSAPLLQKILMLPPNKIMNMVLPYLF
jgi:hypothetical protein